MKLQTTAAQRVRIYTVPAVAEKLMGTYSAATVIDTQGFWMGEAEDAVIIEVVTENLHFADTFVKAHAAAAQDLGEDAILVTVEGVNMRLLNTSQAWLEGLK